MTDWAGARAPSLDDIAALAEAALAALPPEFRRLIGDVAVRVEDFPDAEVMREMAIEDPFDLMGLYWGPGSPFQASGDVPTQTSLIFLYRRPLLDYWAEFDERLGDLVRHVLIHEIGHHLGLSDAAMHAIEARADG